MLRGSQDIRPPLGVWLDIGQHIHRVSRSGHPAYSECLFGLLILSIAAVRNEESQRAIKAASFVGFLCD
jgi:hypothetical protein